MRLSQAADFCFDPTWSPDGTVVAWHEWDVPAMPWDASRIVVAVNSGKRAGVAAGADDNSNTQFGVVALCSLWPFAIWMEVSCHASAQSSCWLH